MLERLAALCVLCAVVTVGIPTLSEVTVEDERHPYGLLDLWAIQSQQQHLTRVFEAQARFWELRDAKLAPLLERKLTLRQAVDRLRAEAESMRPLLCYNKGWSERSITKGLANNIVCAIRFRFEDEECEEAVRRRCHELERELAVMPDDPALD